jgi:hypothetical protein
MPSAPLQSRAAAMRSSRPSPPPSLPPSLPSSSSSMCAHALSVDGCAAHGRGKSLCRASPGALQAAAAAAVGAGGRRSAMRRFSRYTGAALRLSAAYSLSRGTGLCRIRRSAPTWLCTVRRSARKVARCVLSQRAAVVPHDTRQTTRRRCTACNWNGCGVRSQRAACRAQPARIMRMRRSGH